MFPHRFRRRLTVAFVIVAGLSAGGLAATSLLLVRQYRVQAFVDRSVQTTELTIALARRDLSQAAVDRLLRSQPDSVEALLVSGANSYASNPDLAAGQLPEGLADRVGDGEVSNERKNIAGVPYLVVGGAVPQSSSELYLFFSMEEILDGLAQLRNVLLAGWVAVTGLAAVVGNAVARRTLAPVRAATDAARAMAEGLLHTRLPVVGEDEFGAWANYFNRMGEALQDKIAALSEANLRERRFTADVAHELRTPVAALVSGASVLAERIEDLPPGARRPAELVVSDVHRLRRLVEELMEMSRLDAGCEAVSVEPVELVSLVVELVRSCKLDEFVKVEGEPVTVDADRRRLERVAVNLLTNAVEHGGRDIMVRVRREDADAVIEVADGGPGIDEKDLSRVFDRFYKADPSRSSGGSGLGLAIALENARLVGGELAASSPPGGGATFTLRLPLSTGLPSGDGPPPITSGSRSHS